MLLLALAQVEEVGDDRVGFGARCWRCAPGSRRGGRSCGRRAGRRSAGRGPTAARVRNSRGPASPWLTPSASPAPMSCRSRSEKRFTAVASVPPSGECAGGATSACDRSAQPTELNERLAGGDRRRPSRSDQGRHRRGEQPHEERRTFRSSSSTPSGVVASVSVMLFGVAVELAGRRLVALSLEQLVGDAHFDVVGLAGEHQQRLVLRLPAEPRDRAVVAVVVGLPGDCPARDVEVRPAADAQCVLRRGVASRGSPESPRRESVRSGPRRTAASECGRSRCGSPSRVAKSGCAIEQPSAPGRPVMVKSACTPPSGVPSGFRTNLASRTGPST